MTINLFGTAGLRAAAGVSPLNQADLLKFGRALANFTIQKYGPASRILIAGDTRHSTNLIKAQLKAALLEKAIFVVIGIAIMYALIFLG